MTRAHMMFFWALVTFVLFSTEQAQASYADGKSEVTGSFLTLTVVAVDQSVEFHSYGLTEASRMAFASRCAARGPVWVNNTKTTCLRLASGDEEGQIIVTVPGKAWHPSKFGVSMVSLLPAPETRSRRSTIEEVKAVNSELKQSFEGPLVSMDTKAGVIVIAPGRRDDYGNEIQRVLLIANGTHVLGELPSRPLRFIDADGDGLPEAVVEPKGESMSTEIYRLVKRVHRIIYADEG